MSGLRTAVSRLAPKTTLGRILLALAIGLPLVAYALVFGLQLLPPWAFEFAVALASVIAGVIALIWLHSRFPDDDIDSDYRDY